MLAQINPVALPALRNAGAFFLLRSACYWNSLLAALFLIQIARISTFKNP
jgi:hypothetical protein